MHSPLCIVHKLLCITFVHSFYAQGLCIDRKAVHRVLCIKFP